MAIAVLTTKPEWRDPEFGYRLARLKQYQQESPDRPLVLFLGSSRAQNAFQPVAMGLTEQSDSPLAFNFGQAAATPLRVLLTFLRIRDAGIRPAAVVIEVLPAWLAVDGPAEEQFRDYIPRLSLADLRHLRTYCENPHRLWSSWIETRISTWHTQRIVLMSHWLPRWLSRNARVDGQWLGMSEDGFCPFAYADPTPDFRAASTARAHREYAELFDGFQTSAISERALLDLVRRCQAESIAIAFAIPPVSPTFMRWFQPAAWNYGRAWLERFSQEAGVEVFPPPDFLLDHDFVDGHHLLPRGAERYSRWLSETLLKPWLKKQGISQ